MLPRCYSLIIADRTSGVVRRFAIAVRPTLAVGTSVLVVLVALALHTRWTTRAEIERLRLNSATLSVETARYRATAEELAAQMSLLDAAVADLGRRSPLDPRSRRVIGRLPAQFRASAIYGLPGRRDPALTGTPALTKDTFGLLQDLLSNLESRLQVVRHSVARREALAEATPAIWPADGWLSATYGYRTDPFTGERAFHAAVDISTHEGQPIYATATGRVVFASRSGAYGNLVAIEHGFRLKTRYGHLSDFAVKKGDTVTRGDVIGYVGATGRATGTHVHYEVWVNDRAMNPQRLLPSRPLSAN